MRAGAFTLITGAVLAAPVLAGLLGTLLPAFGIMPNSGLSRPGLWPFAELAAWPGLPRSMAVSLFVGLGSTVLALMCAMALLARFAGTGVARAFKRGLAPVLALPHAAAALGLAMLVAPSGLLVRAVSPWATGWDRPPDVLIPGDPWGLALIAGLVIKEVPFLLLMSFAALSQLPERQLRAVSAGLGYGRTGAWALVVLPQLYPLIRLPVFAVLAYSLSVVDMAIILGPSTPPLLSVQILRWMSDPDLSRRALAAAGALLQLGLTGLAVLLWWGLERGAKAMLMRWVAAGRRPRSDRMLGLLAASSGAAVLGGALLAVLALALWSVAGPWPFPDLLPSSWRGDRWLRVVSSVGGSLLTTVWIAGLAAVIALALVLCVLEERRKARASLPPWLVYLPLVMPQVAFLPGLQVLFLMLGIDGGWPSVLAVHLVFVLPYVILSMQGPHGQWDPRLEAQARALGASRARVLWRLRLPMLLPAILTALAIGFAVSVGQYLPTLLIGGGRVSSLTTEAVALSAGGDRRAIGVHALLLMAVSTVPFAIAVSLPRLFFRNRRGMHDVE